MNDLMVMVGDFVARPVEHLKEALRRRVVVIFGIDRLVVLMVEDDPGTAIAQVIDFTINPLRFLEEAMIRKTAVAVGGRFVSLSRGDRKLENAVLLESLKGAGEYMFAGERHDGPVNLDRSGPT